jgi:hypothetical protein
MLISTSLTFKINIYIIQKLKLLGEILRYDLYYSLTHPF